MPRALLIWAVLLVIVGLFVLMIRHVQRIERRALDAARRVLPHHSMDGVTHVLRGSRRGVDVALRLFQGHGASGSGQGLWTDVVLPPAPGVVLELRPQDAVESHLTARGLARDVVLGDTTFDDAFVLEMAPAHLAPLVFDEDVRRRLLALGPVWVTPTAAGGLALRRRGWDEGAFEPMVEAAAIISTRLGREPREAPSPAEQDAERVSLQEVRAARASWTMRNALLVCGALLVIMVLRLLLS